MHSINIIDYAILSAQGDKKETLEAIKNSKINISSKDVSSFDEKVKVPYFLLKNQIADEKEAITDTLKSIVKEIANKLTLKQRTNTALLIGTAMVDKNIIDAVESSDEEYSKNQYKDVKKSIDSYAEDIAIELGLHPFTMSIGTACTSSINALFEARNLINSGVFEYAIVVGVEIFSQILSDGFSAMNLFSFTTQKPFDEQRDGLILGEAIAGVLVGKDDSLWRVRGGDSNCNSYTITSVSASGEEFEEVMKNALKNSDVVVDEITAIKAHATSTLSNDLAEINAISRIFEKNTNITALKPYLGHTLGACGILELAVFISCIDNGFIPKTINHKESINQDYIPLAEHKSCSSGVFMLNYFGFGGNNTVAIIEKGKS